MKAQPLFTMNKKILFIGGNFSPEPTGIGKYNGEMIDLLASQGYECTVITSYPYYPYWKVQEPYIKLAHKFTREVKKVSDHTTNTEIYRCPQYVPKKPTAKRRMILDFSFCFTSFLIILQLLFKPKFNVVIAVVPCFQIGLLGVLYKKIKGAKFIYHIQDLQIDAARELKMIKSRIIINMLLKTEKYILKNADVVSSISLGMIKRIKAKYNREVIYFPNWVDTKIFYPLEEREKLKEEFNFLSTDKIVLYSGAIGEKQGLETIIHAAETLKHHTDLKFVISGSGPYKEKLEQLTTSLHLTNVYFMPLQPLESFNRFLNMADLHLVLQKANANDLVMPSKLTTILSVGGIAIISASKDSNLYEMIASNNMGILIEPDNQRAFIEAVENALNDNNGKMNQNARHYAEEFLSVDKITRSYAVHFQ